MVITIDSAGRVVVPKRFRERLNLLAGTALEIDLDGECLQLRKIDSAPALVTKKGVLVHHGGARLTVDVAAFIRAERDARSRRIIREGRE